MSKEDNKEVVNMGSNSLEEMTTKSNDEMSKEEAEARKRMLEEEKKMQEA